MSSRPLVSWLPTAILIMATFAAGILPPPIFSEDKEDATEVEDADVRPIKEQWDDLFGQRQALIEKLTGLREKLLKAEDDEKQELIQEFEAGREQLLTVLLPRLGKIAAKAFADDPENLEAGEAAVQDAYERNRYAEALKLCEQVLKASGEERDSTITSNIQGIAAFALHDFARAREIFSALEENGKLHPRLGGRYLEVSQQYGEFWDKEQALRKKEAAAKGDLQLPRVSIKTNKGDIELELFENEAPNTVANFISLVEAKKYDGIKFHRVIPNFMAQGGDPNTLDDDPNNDGAGGPGYTIKCECYAKNARKHFRGSISMAHAGKDTGGSQFFLTHLPTPHLNANEEEMRGHTVFGRVIKGMEIVDGLEIGDEIESAAVERKRKHDYEPEKQDEK